MSNDIITKIEEFGLTGRGGAAFPTAQKWLAVKKALDTQDLGYIIVNGAEGEPGVKKDEYILAHKSEDLINGVYLAYKFLGSKKIKKVYFFLKHEYYKKYLSSIKKILIDKKYKSLAAKVEFVMKPETPSYICGEETAILNIIEGKRPEPRLKPPFPSQKGLFGKPTLINNVETLFDVSLIDKGVYQGERLYTLSGAVAHRGVFSLSPTMSAEEILRATNNYPSFDFFVITGGEVCGELLRSDQLQSPVEGSCLLMVLDKKNTDQKKLLDYWLKFYETESCGYCSACREGSYRLRELSQQKNYDKQLFSDLLDNMEESSVCALGSSLPQTVKSFFENIK